LFTEPRSLTHEKQKFFISALQNGILLLGVRSTVFSNKEEFNEKIDSLLSVKYDQDTMLYIENQPHDLKQEFRKLEILKHSSLYSLRKEKLKKTTDPMGKNKLIEENLFILEKFISSCENFKKNTKQENKKVELLKLLDFSTWGYKLLSTKRQLVEKYDLLQKLGKEEEAEKVFQELLEHQAFWKELQEKKEKERSQSENTRSQAKVIKQLIESKKKEKEEFEKLHQQSRELVEQNKKNKLLFSNNPSNVKSEAFEFVGKEDKFIVPQFVEKIKTKGKVGLNQPKEKEKKTIKKKAESNTNQDSEKEKENSKNRMYSEKAEDLSGTAKDILCELFRPYYGEIKWKQREFPQNDIETLLTSAGFVLEKPKSGSSHFKVKRKGESNHLLSIPFHHGRTKGIYLRFLSILLALEGFYPQELEEKLKKDKII
jgi:hypothetical protein